MTMIKTYQELMRLKTFKERYEYLRLNGAVGDMTFGWNRYLNQQFYSSYEWKNFRNRVIVRDNACDLGIDGRDIPEHAIIHHLNPITADQIINRDPAVFDLNNVITTTLDTHNAIHYGDSNLLISEPIIRTKNDTCPWR